MSYSDKVKGGGKVLWSDRTKIEVLVQDSKICVRREPNSVKASGKGTPRVRLGGDGTMLWDTSHQEGLEILLESEKDNQ